MDLEKYLPGTSINTLFDPKPRSMGLRGDHELWDEFSRSDDIGPIPASPADLLRELTARFESSISDGTRSQYSDGLSVASVERLGQGHGMSDGMVSIDWWENFGILLLVSRHPLFPLAELKAREKAHFGYSLKEVKESKAQSGRSGYKGPSKPFVWSLLILGGIFGFIFGVAVGASAVLSG